MAISSTMSEKERALFSIFKAVVEAERGAQAMYFKAFELCEDPALKDLLRSFQEDETRHEKEIMARYKKYLEDFDIELT